MFTTIMRFSEKVLELTKKIPKGKVTTYKAIADKLGSKSYRAVGSALRNNEHPIVIPCHRVINSDRDIGFYSGKYHNPRKRDLLEKEGIELEDDGIHVKKRFIIEKL